VTDYCVDYCTEMTQPCLKQLIFTKTINILNDRKKRIKNAHTLLLYHHPGQQVSAIHVCQYEHMFSH